jgi:hypothetical protein
MRDHKFDGEEVERLKLAARVEDTLPEADRCPACAEARRAHGDPTWLCDQHLKQVYGV